MNTFQELRSSTWAFLEAYGWAAVFTTILAYVIYKKYIYDLVEEKRREKELRNREKLDREAREKTKESVQLARKRQQEEHDIKEREERIKKQEKEREDFERTQKELEEQEKTCQVLGHSASSSAPPATKNSILRAVDIVDNLSGSASIVVFGESTDSGFRKTCQLISTYRLDPSKFQFFEFDKQSNWPVGEVLNVLESRFHTRKSPFVFVCGEFIGGLEETRKYDKEFGLEKAHLKFH